jgi:DNA replication protein DnaC
MKRHGMSQHASSSQGQIQLRPEGYENEGKQSVYVPDRTCPICKGAQRLRIDVPYGDPSFGKSILCSCQQERQKILRQQQRRQAADLDAFRDCTFKSFDYRIPGVQEAVRICLAYALQPQGWLFLLGPCGCGKTHLAAAIANQCLDQGMSVFFATVPDLLDTLRAALVVSERYTQLYAWVRKVELLVLDDLGAQQPSAWSNEKLLQLLEYRNALALPTIITALPQEFQELDERLRSRLTDSQLVTTVLFENVKDFRPFKQATRRRT